MIIEVKVITRAHENAIEEGEIIKVRCKAVPEKGRANELVIALIAAHYNVPKSSVRIVTGKTSSRKRIEITGL